MKLIITKARIGATFGTPALHPRPTVNGQKRQRRRDTPQYRPSYHVAAKRRSGPGTEHPFGAIVLGRKFRTTDSIAHADPNEKGCRIIGTLFVDLAFGK